MATNPSTTTASKTRVMETLLRQVLLGRWQGGDRVTEAQVSEMIGCSRTPVREALLALAGLGVVELKRNVGAVLQPLGPAELGDLYAVRQLLEVEATRLAATRIDPDLVERLRQAFLKLKASGRPDRDWKLDQQLHSAIADACGNPRLAGEIDRYGSLIQSVRETVGGTLQGIHSPTLNEHLQILTQLKKQDPEGAARAMNRHLTQAATSAVKALTQLQKTSTT